MSDITNTWFNFFSHYKTTRSTGYAYLGRHIFYLTFIAAFFIFHQGYGYTQLNRYQFDHYQAPEYPPQPEELGEHSADETADQEQQPLFPVRPLERLRAVDVVQQQEAGPQADDREQTHKTCNRIDAWFRKVLNSAHIYWNPFFMW